MQPVKNNTGTSSVSDSATHVLHAGPDNHFSMGTAPFSFIAELHISRIVCPEVEALPLTITDGDVEGKPVPGIACNTHVS